MADERASLTTALRAGRTREAARLAGQLARDGQWDDVVAATIVIHGRPSSPERAQAATRLQVPLAAAALEDELASPERWTALLDRLADSDRLLDAVDGLVRASAARLIDAGPWLRLALRLASRGDPSAAWILAEGAVARFPDSREAWAVTALLRLDHGFLAEAEEAAARAPETVGARLVRAVLRAHRGDPRGAAAELDAARGLGVPVSILGGFARRCGLEAGRQPTSTD